MKDPAFLFYPSDFLTGTMAMPFEERGRYITLLCFQHQSGRMSEETIRFLVGSFSDMLRLKFSVDENGLFYNERLEEEINKRSNFLESRRNNGRLGGRPKNEEKPLGKPNGKPKKKLHEDIIKDEDDVVIFNNTMVVFENFRKEYMGKKNGFEVEYKNFIKKNNPDEVEKLLPALMDEIDHRERLLSAGLFVAEWKNLSTWINKKCWLQELPEINYRQNGGKQQERSVSERSGELDGAISAVFESKGM